MLFSSMTFIYVFLPIVLVLYFAIGKKFRNLVLLLASFFFYAWGEPKFCLLMFLTIFLNYFGAILIDKYPTKRKIFLFLTVSLNLLVLFYFKYFNFLIDILNSIYYLDIEPLDIILPLGISFYTFQALSYVLDVYKKECKVQKSIYKLALYISLFPQLVAGPIIKYRDIAVQIDSREENIEKVSLGVKRFIIGLSKKVLIANTLGAVADKVFAQSPDSFSPIIAWIGSISYMFQIYFDFSGYSDMALGLGLIFGFKFMENFNYPYISKSLSEFWRRWHISLSTWFKNYVYIPLGGNKSGKNKTYRNLLIVFLLTGIWHGAAMNFVIWGLWHGIFIILEKKIDAEKNEEKCNNVYFKLMQRFYCLFVVLVGWVIFRADSLSYAGKYLLNMLGGLKLNPDNFIYSNSYYVDKFEILIFVVAILCSLPLFEKMIYVKNNFAKIFINLWMLILFFLSTVMIAANTYNPFIYFRF